MLSGFIWYAFWISLFLLSITSLIHLKPNIKKFSLPTYIIKLHTKNQTPHRQAPVVSLSKLLLSSWSFTGKEIQSIIQKGISLLSASMPIVDSELHQELKIEPNVLIFCQPCPSWWRGSKQERKAERREGREDRVAVRHSKLWFSDVAKTPSSFLEPLYPEPPYNISTLFEQQIYPEKKGSYPSSSN